MLWMDFRHLKTLSGWSWEEGFDFRGAHLLEVALVVEKDGAIEPVGVSLLSALGIMPAAQNLPAHGSGV